MKCPFCQFEDTQVKDSRPLDEGECIRRRRECTNCGKRFTTFERFQMPSVIVVKRDGRKELFEAEKLLRSLMVATRKRPVEQTDLNNIVIDVEQMLAERGGNEINSQEIGGMVLEKLKELDFVGYIRYASVYNAFDNVADFEKLMKAAPRA